MAGRRRRILGGPIGRFHFLVLRIPALQAELPEGVRPASLADLDHPRIAQLLATGDHRSRLASGNVCLVAEDTEPVGVVWLNLNGSMDGYGGRWSQPTESVGYLNQLCVTRAARGRGIGKRLVWGVQAAAAATGRQSVTALVRPDNVGSRRIFDESGAQVVGELRGIRVGALSLRHVRTKEAS